MSRALPLTPTSQAATGQQRSIGNVWAMALAGVSTVSVHPDAYPYTVV